MSYIQTKKSDNQKHGESCRTVEYTAWQLMKKRAKKSDSRIRVCDRWLHSYAGESLSIFEWSKKLNMNYANLHNRFRRGWTNERALTTPMFKKVKK